MFASPRRSAFLLAQFYDLCFGLFAARKLRYVTRPELKRAPALGEIHSPVVSARNSRLVSANVTKDGFDDVGRHVKPFMQLRAQASPEIARR